MASCGASATGPLVLRVISNTVKIVNSAGKIIKDIMNSGNLGIVEKEGINDLQTEADRSVQRCIVTSLSRQFPKLTIIGEETLEEKKISDDWIITEHDKDVLATSLPDNLKNIKEEDLVVWVDPLDGTKEYTQGFLDHVTILVGIAVDGKAVGGVIHQPYYNYQQEQQQSSKGKEAPAWVSFFSLFLFFTLFLFLALLLGRACCATRGVLMTRTLGANVAAVPSRSYILNCTRSHRVQILVRSLKRYSYEGEIPGVPPWSMCAVSKT
ncbi:3'(2'),5'-bisphosphate nucleotidase 1 isoform X2 [Ixodes scapularis]|uniref:3'(2'),5'-bisphosphate nucleotidase 1 isoform X2 n=1 Tax=Ixodes scapularis TaxID=6945 RepID=UPI001A9ECE6B|nr:3'(2'),5'-bisphosphate nucleotidase 1 isoform X2 [Ixodes scapularis]